MGKKRNKPVSPASRSLSRHARNSAGPHEYPWGTMVLYGILGAIASYFIHTILVFHTAGTQDLRGPLALLSGIIAFAGASKMFEENVPKLIYPVLGLTIFQILANLAVSYEWVAKSTMMTIIAITLTIPLAILWFFIFRYTVITKESEPPGNVYSFREVFSSKLHVALGLIILGVGGFLLFYRLGYFDIWEDENLVITAALGLEKQGLTYLDKGYDRAWIHSLLIAGLFEVFGDSELIGRLPSAIFGLLFMGVCFYVFTRWFGIASIALLVPIVCMMNDRFLILFRYMRMYALLIPIFLLAVYIFHRTVTLQNGSVFFRGQKIPWLNKRFLYGALSILFLLLLAHLHKLAMIVLPVFFIFISILVLQGKRKELRNGFIAFIIFGLIIAFFTFVVKLDAFRMFSQATKRILAPHQIFPVYYTYMFENGLPVNSTIMSLLAGLGLFTSRLSVRLKYILFLSYLFIMLALLFMIYLIAGEGRDYRYIAHIVPFVAGISLFVWYQIGCVAWKKHVGWWMALMLIISSVQLWKEYKKVYVRHPWAPAYSTVYATLENKFKEGDALFAQNIKTYYLDPEELAGEQYHKISWRDGYTFQQFKEDILEAKRGWFIWEKHKAHHWDRAILKYIYANFKIIHGGQRDDYGLDLFYFDEGMIK